MVKKLIPNVATGGMADMSSIVTTKFDYSQLDLPSNNVRLRLRSTAINVENSKKGADVIYMNAADKNTYKISAKKVIMANYNSMIPYESQHFHKTKRCIGSKCKNSVNSYKSDYKQLAKL